MDGFIIHMSTDKGFFVIKNCLKAVIPVDRK